MKSYVGQSYFWTMGLDPRPRVKGQKSKKRSKFDFFQNRFFGIFMVFLGLSRSEKPEKVVLTSSFESFWSEFAKNGGHF